MEIDEEWQTEKRYLPQSSAVTRLPKPFLQKNCCTIPLAGEPRQYWDIADRRHETQYTFNIYSPAERVQGSDPVAPGMFFNYRRTTIESALFLRLHTKVRMLCKRIGTKLKPRHLGVVVSCTSTIIHTDN
jgi:hypothetical protein